MLKDVMRTGWPDTTVPLRFRSQPPVPALPDTERRTSYSVSGTTCACAVNFAIYGDSTDIDEWSKNMAKSFGISRQSALNEFDAQFVARRLEPLRLQVSKPLCVRSGRVYRLIRWEWCFRSRGHPQRRRTTCSLRDLWRNLR